MLAMKDSCIVHISNTVRLIISFISRDQYFLHIRRGVHDVQHAIDILRANGVFVEEIDTSSLPRVRKVYEMGPYEREKAAQASLTASVQDLAAAAIDLDIDQYGGPVMKEYHTIAGVPIAYDMLDSLTATDPSIEERIWHDGEKVIVFESIPTKLVNVIAIIDPESAVWWFGFHKYEQRVYDIASEIFPGAEIIVRHIRIRNPNVDSMMRFMRKHAQAIVNSDHAQIIKIGDVAARAVRIDSKTVDKVSLAFKQLERGFYRDIIYVPILLPDGVYYIIYRCEGEWYIAKKVD